MATPAYVPINPDTPQGITQAPDAYSASDLANVRALRDALVCSFVPGWTFAIDTAAFPLIKYTWTSGLLRLRLTLTQTLSGTSYFTTKAKWEWSNDNGVLFQPMNTGNVDANLTVTASGTVTAMDRDAGILPLLTQALNKGQYGADQMAGHAGGIGTAVHGLGSMSTQNANAVAITGGTLGGVNINGSTFDNFARAYPVAPPTLVNNGVWNWAGGVGSQAKLNPGHTISGIANSKAGQVMRIWVTGGGAVTIASGSGVAFQWATGNPVWGAAATIISFVAVEDGYVIGTTTPVG